MGPEEAAYAARLLGVAHLIPIHYATFPMLTGTPEALTGFLSDDKSLKVHLLRPGETLK